MDSIRKRVRTWHAFDIRGLGLILCTSTLVSHSGSLLHVGQTFFDETLSDEVYKTTPYTENKNTRTLNSDDSILGTAFKNGYNAYTR